MKTILILAAVALLCGADPAFVPKMEKVVEMTNVHLKDFPLSSVTKDKIQLMDLDQSEIKCLRSDAPFTPFLCGGRCSNASCDGRELYVHDWKKGGKVSYNPFTVTPINHMPYEARASSSRSQVRYILREFPGYDDASAYKPLRTRSCTFHPHERFDHQTTQMLIGRTNEEVRVSMTGVRIRLPDKYFGLFLAYAQDQYGLNPNMLLGLAAKETFATAVYPERDNSYFLVDGENDHFDCFNTDGLCVDNNHDGIFQVETPALSTDVSCMPHRLWAGDLKTPKAERTPIYISDNEYLTGYANFREFHDWLVMDPYRAVVGTSLDFHFRHNVILLMEKQGLRPVWEMRNDREGKDALEFAAAMYTYNRGLFGNMDLSKCTPDKDPITDCGLDGFGEHSKDINRACMAIDAAEEVYEFSISWSDVEFFIDKLEETYPFDSIPGVQFLLVIRPDRFAQVFEFIEWDTIRTVSREAYDMIARHRLQKDIKYQGISFRYDWRLLLAVIRAYLPEKEVMAGPTMESITLQAFGDKVKSDPGPYATTGLPIVDPFEVPAGDVTVRVPPNEPGPFATSLSECFDMASRYSRILSTPTSFSETAATYYSYSILKFGNWDRACFLNTLQASQAQSAIEPFIDSSVLLLGQSNSMIPQIDFFSAGQKNVPYSSELILHVRARGTYPLHFKWYFRGVGRTAFKELDYPGSALRINSHMSGEYYVEVSNSLGISSTVKTTIIAESQMSGVSFVDSLQTNPDTIPTIFAFSLARTLGFEKKDVAVLRYATVAPKTYNVFFAASEKKLINLDNRLEYALSSGKLKQSLNEAGVVGTFNTLDRETIPGYQYSYYPDDPLKIFWSVVGRNIKLGFISSAIGSSAVCIGTNILSLAFSVGQLCSSLTTSNATAAATESSTAPAPSKRRTVICSRRTRYTQRCKTDGSKQLTEKTGYLSYTNTKKLAEHVVVEVQRSLSTTNQNDYQLYLAAADPFFPRSIGKALPVFWEVSNAGSKVPYKQGHVILMESLREGFLAIDCKLSSWVLSENCSAECGGGVEVWTREILVNSIGSGKPCEELRETRPCNTQECHPCTINNGGCSPYAICELNEQEKVVCECKPGFEGDGISCPYCEGRGDGLYCWPIDCCNQLYYCSNGNPSGLSTLAAGTACYKGEIVHSYDSRCNGVVCQLPYPPVCGDKICNGTESCSTCPDDISLCLRIRPIIQPSDPNWKGVRRIISYFTNWSQYRWGIGTFLPENIYKEKFTHVIYAFAVVEDKSYSVKPYEWNDIVDWNPSSGLYARVTSQMHAAGIKALIGIGGWNFNMNSATSHIFSDMSSTQANRRKFITSLMTFMRDNNFDGVELDWEYPGWKEQGGRPEDKENFSLLVKEIREAINSEVLKRGQTRFDFSIAVAGGIVNENPWFLSWFCGEDKIKLGYNPLDLVPYLDWIHIMTYDFHGAFDPVTGSHTPVEAYPGSDTKYTLSYAVLAWMSRGLPRDKMVLGFATYGRSWTLRTSDPGQGYNAAATGAGNAGRYTQEAGVLAYYEIKQMIADGGVETYEPITMSAHVQFKNQFVAFDNEESLKKKMEWINTVQPFGIAIWSFSEDLFKEGYPLITTILGNVKISGPETGPTCGDGTCNGDETCGSCPSDCGPCSFCGDGHCGLDEDCSSCPVDCGLCSPCSTNNGGCDPNADCIDLPHRLVQCICKPGFTGNGATCMPVSSTDPNCDGKPNGAVCHPTNCCPQFYICSDNQATTILDTPPGTTCIDGSISFPNDERCMGKKCGNGTSICGDGLCSSDESCSSCPQDISPPFLHFHFRLASLTVVRTASENCESCPSDCGSCAFCGNKVCDLDESCGSCPEDCGECPPVCGDGKCTSTENCHSCPQDCGSCPAYCGDGKCSDGETCSTCPKDCGTCGESCPQDGIFCYPSNCCNQMYICDGGTSSPFLPVPSNTLCYDGVIIFQNDARCKNSPCGGQSCGDGQCNGDETCTTCPQDCGVCPIYCGDGQCNGGESCSSCPQDCGVCPPSCGDGKCDPNESCSTCSQDCGECPPICGDGQCSGFETCSNCPQDCGSCPPICGDGQCNGVETCSSCPQDCGACPTFCGDGECNSDETCGSCPQDCGTCHLECPNEGVFCWPNDCCNHMYSCQGGSASGVMSTPQGTKCYAGSIVFDWDERCKGRDCNSPVCGDRFCDSSESCESCPQDCGECPSKCGDGVCEKDEDCNSCPADCGKCSVCKKPNIILGYFTNWVQYRPKNQYFPENINARGLTHINYAFAVVEDKTWRVIPYEWNDVVDWNPSLGLYARFNKHVRQQNPGIKTLISIGGWNFNLFESTKYIFSNMASTAENRRQFITSSISFARTHNFDGIDVDWEYPGFEDQGGHPRDKVTFTALLREMREAINREKIPAGRSRLLLTIAVGMGYDKIACGYEINMIHPYVDYIALMSYDMHGAWDKETFSHTPIYSGPKGEADKDSILYKYTISYGLSKWVAGGCPRTKLVMGVAFYGRCWTLASSAPGQGQLSKATGEGKEGEWTRTAGFLGYFEIERMRLSGGLVSYDNDTRSAYIQKGDQWCSYDTMESLTDKVNYAMDESLEGLMIWALDQDEYITEDHPLLDWIVKSSNCDKRRDGDDPDKADQPDSGTSSHDGLVLSDVAFIVTGAVGAAVVLAGVVFFCSRPSLAPPHPPPVSRIFRRRRVQKQQAAPTATV